MMCHAAKIMMMAAVRGPNTDNSFKPQVQFAQDAGAVAVIVVNSQAGEIPLMTGATATVTIPSVMVSQIDGATLRGVIDGNRTLTVHVPSMSLLYNVMSPEILSRIAIETCIYIYIYRNNFDSIMVL
jgi:hypothetical protein